MCAVTTNSERAFAERPEVLAAWVQLNTAIKAGMDLRRYELATLAATQLRERSGVDHYDLAVVLGSGWKEGADALGAPTSVVATSSLSGFASVASVMASYTICARSALKRRQ